MLPLHQSPRNARFAGDSELCQALARAWQTPHRLYTAARRSACVGERERAETGGLPLVLGYPSGGMWRCLATALAVLAVTAVPASASTTPGDAVATHAYLEASYVALHAVVGGWPTVEADIHRLDLDLRGECPDVAAGSPQSAVEQKLSDEVVGALWVISYRADAAIVRRFLHAVDPLKWSNPGVTRAARAYARNLHAMTVLPTPSLCADVRAWIASGFLTVPADTEQFDRHVEAIEIKELPRKLLAPYLASADRALMARVEREARRFEELEFVQGQDDWDALLETLGLNQ